VTDKKISELVAATSVASVDTLTLVQGGVNKKAPAGLVSGLVLIERKVLSSTGDFDFTSIPAEFTSLLIQGAVRAAVAATNTNMLMRLNGDTGSNYDGLEHTILNTVTSGPAAAAGSSILLGTCAASTATANNATPVEISFPASRNAFFKTGTGVSGRATGTANTTFGASRVWWQWRNTSPITSILVYCSGSFLSGSELSLYGWRG
jgi:hypothetical protein